MKGPELYNERGEIVPADPVMPVRYGRSDVPLNVSLRKTRRVHYLDFPEASHYEHDLEGDSVDRIMPYAFRRSERERMKAFGIPDVYRRLPDDRAAAWLANVAFMQDHYVERYLSEEDNFFEESTTFRTPQDWERSPQRPVPPSRHLLTAGEKVPREAPAEQAPNTFEKATSWLMAGIVVIAAVTSPRKRGWLRNLLPLDRAGRLGSDVVNDSVDTTDFTNDPARNNAE